MKKRLWIMCLAGAMILTNVGCGAGGGTAETSLVSYEETADMLQDRLRSELDGELDGTVQGSADGKPVGQETEAGNGAGNVQQIAETAGESAQQKENESEEADMKDHKSAAPAVSVPEISMEKRTLNEGADTSAIDFAEKLKVGWNLGNTFDAGSDQNRQDEMSFESLWCGVKTTKEMIDALKAAGFETLRIPVSWHNHVSDDGSYTISSQWLDRVQEVVDYAMDNDMYVILNIHHDNSTGYMYPSQEYADQSKAYIKSVWTQLAQRFADYDEHLLMESLNEPRLVGTNYEWWLDLKKNECVEAVKLINEYNQLFVDTVRASGSHNSDRYLLVPGYDASLQGASNEYFELPKDTEGNENRILVEVHAYTPYDFALQSPDEKGSTAKWNMDKRASTSEIDTLMDTLFEKYVKNGTGVVIDEFGARDKGGNTQARVDFTAYYIAAARARRISCCWWDNNAFAGNGENFGIFRRSDCTFAYPEIVEAMMKYCE